MSAEQKLRRPKCPKCRKPPKSYREMWTRHWISFDADAEGRPDQEGELSPGEPDYVIAICACGHSWRLKGIRQIIQLEQQPGADP